MYRGQNKIKFLVGHKVNKKTNVYYTIYYMSKRAVVNNLKSSCTHLPSTGIRCNLQEEF